MIKEIETIKLSETGHGYEVVHVYEDEDGDVAIDFGHPNKVGESQTIWLKCHCGTEETIKWLRENLHSISYRWE